MSAFLLAAFEVLGGYAYANFVEWILHKFLHGAGSDQKSFWSFHWHEHHRASRRAGFFDPQYERPLLRWGSPQLKEAVSVLGIALAHAPLLPFFPVFTLTVFAGAARYYFVHRYAHLNPQWAKKHLPWHYDHHMGKDQNANWCATGEWFDLLMGTRKRYRYDAAGQPVAEDAVPAPRPSAAAR